MKRKPGVKFNRVHAGVFERRADAINSVRYSTFLRALRKNGTPEEALKEFESDKALYGSDCPIHGVIEDPIIGLTGEGAERRVAFACPWCSGPEALALWEKEGMRS